MKRHTGTSAAVTQTEDLLRATLARTAPLGRWLVACAFVFGLLLAAGLLSGDARGRVNLLYVLILFVFWPLAALLGSLLLLTLRARPGVAAMLSSLALWPASWREALDSLGRRGLSRNWLFIRTQAMSLGFSCGVLGGFFLMLLGTDVSFVWRSTLLEADQLLPVLHALALPWRFWPDAQPSTELLQLTRDSRMLQSQSTFAVYGQWWRFLLMAQLCYALLPRAMLLTVGHALLRLRLERRRPRSSLEFRGQEGAWASPSADLAEVLTRVDGAYALLCLPRLAQPLREAVLAMLGPAASEIDARPLALLETDPELRQLRMPLVVIVAAQEPPMAELADLLGGLHGYLLPVDVTAESWTPVGDTHLEEWRRFAATLRGWRVLSPERVR